MKVSGFSSSPLTSLPLPLPVQEDHDTKEVVVDTTGVKANNKVGDDGNDQASDYKIEDYEIDDYEIEDDKINFYKIDNDEIDEIDKIDDEADNKRLTTRTKDANDAVLGWMRVWVGT